MRLWRRAMLFSAGGCAYMLIELLWRGWTHESMFFAGGGCFLLLGQLERTRPRLSLPARAAMASLVITSVELLMGLLVNRSYLVWDYRLMPWNFYGQVCLPFCLLWAPFGLAAMAGYNLAERYLPGG